MIFDMMLFFDTISVNIDSCFVENGVKKLRRGYFFAASEIRPFKLFIACLKNTSSLCKPILWGSFSVLF